jgi:hypothetical protein
VNPLLFGADEHSTAEFTAYSKRYLISRLRRKYDKNLFVNGHRKVVCFRNFMSHIIQETWIQQQCQSVLQTENFPASFTLRSRCSFRQVLII